MDFDDINAAAARFSRALEAAPSLDGVFKTALQNSRTADFPSGTSVGIGADGSFFAVVLGVDFRLKSFPVVIDGNEIALEHTFVGSFMGSDRVSFVAYQLVGGILAYDSAGERRICDVNSTNLTRNILRCLVPMVIGSDIYRAIA